MKTIVIKIGTNILTTDSGKLDLNNLRELVYQISDIKHKENINIIIISSGAITCGSEKIGFSPKSIPEKQAAAAVGQILVCDEYSLFFAQKNLQIGQILVTKNGLKEKVTKNNILNTLNTLLEYNIIPIMNENDSVATDEIGEKYGDNDELSAEVAKLVQADKLLILTDIDGVFTDNPFKNKEAKLIHTIEKIDKDILSFASEHTSTKSRGGMKSKLKAAKTASESGINVIIANGRQKNIINDIISESMPGTLIKAKQ